MPYTVNYPFNYVSCILFYKTKKSPVSKDALCAMPPHCAKSVGRAYPNFHSASSSSTKHHFQLSPGSYDLITGWPVFLKCFVPCLFGESSQ